MEETNDTQSIAASLDEKLGETPAPQAAAVSETPESDSPTVDEQSVSEEVQKKLFAGKYESTEALEKAYKEAEKKLGSLSKEASVAKKLAEFSNMSIEEIEAQIEEQKKQKIVDEGGNPELMALQEEVNMLKVERIKNQFDREFDDVLKAYPQLAEARASVREFYMSKTDDSSVSDIVETLISPIISATKEESAQKLESKVASNPQSTQGSGPEVADDRKDALKLASSNKTEDVAKALEMLGIK